MRKTLISIIVGCIVVAGLAAEAPAKGGRFGGLSVRSSGGFSSSRSSSGGGSRFGGGSVSSRPSSTPRFGGSAVPSSRPSAPSSSSGFRFGGGSTSKPSAAPVARPSAPRATDPGSSVAKARLAAQSASAKRTAEAPTVRTPSGRTVRVAPAVAASVKPQAASTRTTRITKVYNVRSYGSWHPHPYGGDAYHPMLTGFLLGGLAAAATRPAASAWVYHHWDDMDPARREELLRENASLRGELEAMRARGVVRDANYTMPGVDGDLLYNDQAAGEIYRAGEYRGPTFWTVAKWMAFLTLVALAVYCVFFYRSERWFGAGHRA